ncbi:MAG: type II toxin-antitoxin system HicB family antitoxin [Tepidiformaceae bacterium]
MRSYTVVLSPDPGGGYSVTCPAMPGAASQGDSREESLANIVEAMTGWYEVAVEGGFGPRDETAGLVAAWIADILTDRAEESWPLLVETAIVSIGSVAAVA